MQRPIGRTLERQLQGRDRCDQPLVRRRQADGPLEEAGLLRRVPVAEDRVRDDPDRAFERPGCGRNRQADDARQGRGSYPPLQDRSDRRGLKGETQFTIDRTLWGMTHAKGSVDDEVEIAVRLVFGR